MRFLWKGVMWFRELWWELLAASLFCVLIFICLIFFVFLSIQCHFCGYKLNTPSRVVAVAHSFSHSDSDSHIHIQKWCIILLFFSVQNYWFCLRNLSVSLILVCCCWLGAVLCWAVAFHCILCVTRWCCVFFVRMQDKKGKVNIKNGKDRKRVY